MSDTLDTTIIQPSHNHKNCMQHALQAAEQICKQKGLRLTSIRKRILELICTSHKAIGAYELLDLFKQEDPKAKPVTIYRALDFLMEVGLVHKIESLNAFIGCLQSEKQHQTAILICDHCKNAYEVDAPIVYENLLHLSQNLQFKTQKLTIELRGLCVNCVNHENSHSLPS
ncbi:MAG: transcriptional repressor [Methyloprofundus sp.]|nr:transcriptional repressor [Methyloprofundus sp.]